MYKKYYNEYFMKCLQELKNTNIPEIQYGMKKLKKDFKEDDFDTIISPFVSVLSNQIIPYLEGEDIENAMLNEFEEFFKITRFMRKTYVLDIRLQGQETNCWRTIQLPATMTLAQVCYAVLSTFHCEGSHLFSIEYNKTAYYCEGYDSDMYGIEDEYAADVVLPELNLRKGSHMVMTYGFGDNYMFDITVKEVKNFYHRVTSDDVCVIDGKGYGIWEDDHYAMNLYYNNPEKFKEYIEQNGLEYEYYPIDEDCDLDELNEEIVNDIAFFTETYEYSEEFNNRFQ